MSEKTQTTEQKLLHFVREVKAYTAPWAVNQIVHLEVFRKAMLNINEDATKVLEETGMAESKATVTPQDVSTPAACKEGK